MNSSCNPVVLFLGAEEIGSSMHIPFYSHVELQHVFPGDWFSFQHWAEPGKIKQNKVKPLLKEKHFYWEPCVTGPLFTDPDIADGDWVMHCAAEVRIWLSQQDKITES